MTIYIMWYLNRRHFLGLSIAKNNTYFLSDYRGAQYLPIKKTMPSVEIAAGVGDNYTAQHCLAKT
ncbi:hypothetical protein DSUL_20143 [Desulfovibrionales bacterium]